LTLPHLLPSLPLFPPSTLPPSFTHLQPGG
jgi:hypothetical protein